MINPSQSLRLSLVAGVLLLAGSAHAQMDPGFLGKRYAGASLFLETVHGSELDAGSGILGSANLPLSANLDLHGYGYYERFSDFDVRDKRIGASVLAYREYDYFKPFIEGGLAGSWQSSTIAGRKYESHDGLYIAGLGVEAAVSRQSALFIKATLNKYFDSDNGDYWTYTGGVNTWFNDKIGGLISVAFNESETTVYTFGLFVRF
jgi:hypothetical protein